MAKAETHYQLLTTKTPKGTFHFVDGTRTTAEKFRDLKNGRGKTLDAFLTQTAPGGILRQFCSLRVA
jgi:hypothetical protein